MESVKQPEINKVDSFGLRAIDYALSNNDKEIQQLLEENGAEATMVVDNVANEEEGELETPGSVKTVVDDMACENEVESDVLSRISELENLDKKNDQTGDTLLCTTLMANDETGAEILIKHGAAFEDVDIFQNSAIMIASGAKLNKVVSKLLRLGASCTSLNLFGDSALHYAAKEGNWWACEQLIRCGHGLDLQNDAGYTPLHLCVSNGHLKTTQILIKFGAKIKIQDKFSRNALHHCCLAGHFQICKFLLENCKKKIIGKRDRAGCTALMLAAMSGHAPLIELLESHGASLETADHFGNTAAILAVNGGHMNCLIKLTDLGANLTVRNRSGSNCLLVAAGLGYVAICNYLFEHLPEEVIQVKMQQTGNNCLHIAALTNHTKVIDSILRHTKHKLINSLNNFSMTPICIAAMKGHFLAVATLICNGAIYDGIGGSGTGCNTLTTSSPIHLAAIGDHCDIIQLLLSTGTDVERRDQFGNTPLIISSSLGNFKSVDCLLEFGAKMEAVNSSGNTALIAAALNGNFEMAFHLIERGADCRLKNFSGISAMGLMEPKMVNMFLGRRHQSINDKILVENGSNQPSSLRLPDFLFAALNLLNATINAK